MIPYELELSKLYPGDVPVPGFKLGSHTHHQGAHLANQKCLKCQAEIREVVTARHQASPIGPNSLSTDLLPINKPVSAIGLTPEIPTCPNCPNSIKPGRTYCSPTCALVFAAHKRRKVDPERLKDLHLIQWLPRSETAKLLNVTVGAINSALGRQQLTRKKAPEICRIPNCNKPTYFRTNSQGQKIGNTCKPHWLERARHYSQKHRSKTFIPVPHEQKSQNSKRAAQTRWAKPHPPTLAELVKGLLQSRGPMKLEHIQKSLNKPRPSIVNALRRNPQAFSCQKVGIYSLTQIPCPSTVSVSYTKIYFDSILCKDCGSFLLETTQPQSPTRTFIHSGKPIITPESYAA